MKTRGRPKKTVSNIFYIRLPEALAAKLREDAEREKRDLTATIERILEKHYEEVEA